MATGAGSERFPPPHGTENYEGIQSKVRVGESSTGTSEINVRGHLAQ